MVIKNESGTLKVCITDPNVPLICINKSSGCCFFRIHPAIKWRWNVKLRFPPLLATGMRLKKAGIICQHAHRKWAFLTTQEEPAAEMANNTDQYYLIALGRI